MLAKRVFLGVFVFCMFFVFTLGIGMYDSLQPANAAVFTSDVNNTLQNTKTAISTATTAINTATQVANEVRNLASMSPEGILAHYLGISKELGNLVGVWQAYNGLISATTNMETAWNSTFKQVNTFFSGGTSTLSGDISNSQNAMNALQKTYMDSMTISQALTSTKDTTARLQTALNKSANATGAKEAVQSHTQVASIIAQEEMKTNSLLAEELGMNAGKYQFELQERAASSARVLSEHTSWVTATSTMYSNRDAAITDYDGFKKKCPYFFSTSF